MPGFARASCSIFSRCRVSVQCSSVSSNLGQASRRGKALSESPWKARGRPYHDAGSRRRPTFKPRHVVGLAILGLCGIYASNLSVLYAEAPSNLSAGDAGDGHTADTTLEETNGGQESLRKIRLAEVQKHDRTAARQWVTRGTKVYDITDWIDAHPGGQVILRAVGGAVDRYWDIFSIHQKDEVYQILESYCIGIIDPRDLINGQVPAGEIEDPFAHDPSRHKDLKMLSQQPCNAEASAEALESFITPTNRFFVRNHLWVPQSDPDAFFLTVELPDGTEKRYSLDDLKHRFPATTIVATLQCSGNRRSHLSAVRPASGLPWSVGAISTASWTGARLRDVLADAGFDISALPTSAALADSSAPRHAHLIGAEAYAASIPLTKALDPAGDVLLAYEMNGAPLPRDHGAPLRALVPGIVAARSVKWLERIALASDESPSQWQQRDYKCFGPNESAAHVDWASAPAIQETPVQSAIVSVRDAVDDKTAPADAVEDKTTPANATALSIADLVVAGYAFAGGGRRIVRVDVSVDDGRSWRQAELLPDLEEGTTATANANARAWAWQRWRLRLPKPEVGSVIVVKAVDEAYNVQPEWYEPQWNFRGNLTTAWHRVEYRPR